MKVIERNLYKNKANNQFYVTLPKKMFTKTVDGKKVYLEPKSIKMKDVKFGW